MRAVGAFIHLQDSMNRIVSRILTGVAIGLVLMAILASCSSTKHVPQGELLLDKVDIHITDPHKDVEESQLMNYLRQNANHRVLGGLKLQLAFYNMSGHDTTKWYNRWIQRVGTCHLRQHADTGKPGTAAHRTEQPWLHEEHGDSSR